ncbi:uncharacterized protein LOC133203177 [Saccostrea echinata]|uniref:uncharacterized protein LOC133203177 n=1 Tax=Saccostrea echinata TaxID=191078 RepID=UPI002A81B837|nr:uncharacterized protein LOC133203177 [Saccostrea echinata]
MVSKLLWLLISTFISLGLCTQKRALPDPKSFDGMMAAISLPTMQQENFQRMCLQNIPTQVLLREVYTRMGKEDAMSKSLPDPVDPELQRTSPDDSIMTQKRRGRNRISGFYSNW